MRNHQKSFLVHEYELDPFGQLSVGSIGAYLQEAASGNVRALGCPINALMREGRTWVLGRMRFEILEPIGEGDRLDIDTWPSGCERLTVKRDWEVRREDGRVVLRADSLWLILALETRRPVRPETVIDPQLLEESRHLLPSAREKLARLERWDHERCFEVRYQDIDMNHHASNIAYLSWLIEAVSPATREGSRLASVDVQYVAECHHGSRIASRALAQDDGQWLHSVIRLDDDRELARARTGWVPRTSPGSDGGVRPAAPT